MTATLKRRRQHAFAVMSAVSEWAREQPDVAGLALVGSYAYGQPRMSSDVDLVLLTSNIEKHATGINWLGDFDPRARLIRDQSWGPLRERRARLRSGLHVELGIGPAAWAALPLDPGTAKVLRDGCQVLHDPEGILQRALTTLSSGHGDRRR